MGARLVTEASSSTYEYLLARYGPLLTLKHLAEVMHVTPGGLRIALSRRSQPFAVELLRARRRVGRRMYFEARRVAEAIDEDFAVTDTMGRRDVLPLKHERGGQRAE